MKTAEINLIINVLEPVIGVIHNPFEQKTVWAWSGKVFSENLANVKKDDESVVKNPIVIVSRSHAGKNLKSFIDGAFVM